jgi:hypothetical protein
MLQDLLAMTDGDFWWSGRPGERYWMEITDRKDLGSDLHAPQRGKSGRPHWSSLLATAVQEGDIVLHWWKRSGKGSAIVGWSTAVGTIEEIMVEPYAGSGRVGGSSPSPGWRIRLANFTRLQSPITLSDLRGIEPTLRAVKGALAASVSGRLYFPFVFSDRRPMRPTQAYLAKMPADLVAVIPSLAAQISA